MSTGSLFLTQTGLIFSVSGGMHGWYTLSHTG